MHNFFLYYFTSKPIVNSFRANIKADNISIINISIVNILAYYFLYLQISFFYNQKRKTDIYNSYDRYMIYL